MTHEREITCLRAWNRYRPEPETWPWLLVLAAFAWAVWQVAGVWQ